MTTATNSIFQNLQSGKTLSGVTITGRFKDKFQQGWLGGCGSTSQFQGVNQALPIMPSRSNYDLTARIESSNGVYTGTPLQPSWQRSYAFAPGRGIDALESRITHTIRGAGMEDTITGVAAPIINPGQDRFETGPIVALKSYQGGGQDAMQTPYVATGGEAGAATQAALSGPTAADPTRQGYYTARSKKDIKALENTRTFMRSGGQSGTGVAKKSAIKPEPKSFRMKS